MAMHKKGYVHSCLLNSICIFPMSRWSIFVIFDENSRLTPCFYNLQHPIGKKFFFVCIFTADTCIRTGEDLI